MFESIKKKIILAILKNTGALRKHLVKFVKTYFKITREKKDSMEDIFNHLMNRKWFWSSAEGASRFKDITIRIDTRTNDCYMFDRDGKEFTLEDLIKIKPTESCKGLNEISQRFKEGD